MQAVYKSPQPPPTMTKINHLVKILAYWNATPYILWNTLAVWVHLMRCPTAGKIQTAVFRVSSVSHSGQSGVFFCSRYRRSKQKYCCTCSCLVWSNVGALLTPTIPHLHSSKRMKTEKMQRIYF